LIAPHGYTGLAAFSVSVLGAQVLLLRAGKTGRTLFVPLTLRAADLAMGHCEPHASYYVLLNGGAAGKAGSLSLFEAAQT